MARNLSSTHRDYGATSSTNSSAITVMPDVNFSGFSPTEFMSLSENIAHNIYSVKSSMQQLEKALKMIGTNRFTQATQDKIHHIQAQTNIKIQSTSKDLQKLTSIVRRGDKQQRLQVEKLTSDFAKIIEKYSQTQQQFAMKTKQMYLQQQSTAAILAQQQDEEVSDTNLTALEREQLIKQQKQIQNDLKFENDILKEYEGRIKEIEGDVLDVNEIMRELSSLINQQGEQIDTIESSIDRTCTEVEAGTAELRKAAQYRTRYRRKVFVLLLIAVIVGLIVTGIIISQMKS